MMKERSFRDLNSSAAATFKISLFKLDLVLYSTQALEQTATSDNDRVQHTLASAWLAAINH